MALYQYIVGIALFKWVKRYDNSYVRGNRLRFYELL